MSRRAQQAEERREQIIDAALRVFAEKGWDRTTIPDLAQAAGIAQGLLYHYFRNKEDLLLAVVERHSFLSELQSLLSISGERPAKEVLLEVAETFTELLQKKQDIAQIFLREAQVNPDIAQKKDALIQGGIDLLTRYISARITMGELRPHEPSLTAHVFLYTIFMSQLIHSCTQLHIPDFVEFLLQSIVQNKEPHA